MKICMLGPGHVIAGTKGKHTYIGELDGRIAERATRIAQTLTKAGLATEVSANIMGTMWDKLPVDVATGALAGITRLPYGEVYRVAELEQCALAAVLEAALAEAYQWEGVTGMAQGRNCLALPDGLCVEIIQATGHSVGAALTVDPRA